jgi:hypothetical protein
MASLRAGAGAVWLVRALWRFVRGLLILLAVLLGADLLAVVLVVPAMLLGPAGIPITAGLLFLGGYAARKVVVARRSADERRRQLEREWMRRRRKAQRRSRTLQLLEGAGEPERVGYREAASEIGFFGYAGGLLVCHVSFVVAFNIWPDRVKALPLLAVLGAVIGWALVGFGVVVLYRVHLHPRVGGWVLAWRLRRLGGKLAPSAAKSSAVPPEIAELSFDLPPLDDLVDTGDSGGADSGD